MDLKEIYIIRHGQTDYNLKGIVQGRGVDSSLNETGKKQAQAFFEMYKKIPFEHIYISELKRTKQTVKAFIGEGISFTKLPSLDEINWGKYEGIMQTADMKADYNGIIQQWRNGNLTTKIEGGESAQDLWDRQVDFIETIKNAPYQKFLVCSHGRSIRSLLCYFTGTPLKDMDDFPHSNTCLNKLTYDGEKFELKISNSTEHLPASIKQIKTH